MSPSGFLEPLYLNEKMVLNCAAHVFKGFSLETEETNRQTDNQRKSITAGLSFLEKLISFGGEAHSDQEESTQTRTARRYTVGGLHMSLIEALRESGALDEVDPAEGIGPEAGSKGYIGLRVTLRPIDLLGVIETLRISTPIIGEILKSFVRPWYEQKQRSAKPPPLLPESSQTFSKRGAERRQANARPTAGQERPGMFEQALINSESYVAALEKVLSALEEDYRRSRQLEMVMWAIGSDSRPLGVVDMDIVDHDPHELRGKLVDGDFLVIGKISRRVGEGESIQLMRRSTLYSVLDILTRAMQLQGETPSLRQYHGFVDQARTAISQFGLLEVPGPAVRISAMSVCI